MTVTELDSRTMADEPTQAANTDPNEGETQSLHAWSQADDGEPITTYIPRRKWTLPYTLAALAAAAAVGATVYLANTVADDLPRHTPSAAAPTAAPAEIPVPAPPTITASPPVNPMNIDDRFLALLKQRGVIILAPPIGIKGAHDTCTELAQGYNARQIADAFVRGTPGVTIATEAIFVATAQEVYCP
jgi:Protein of unknown function (DUF732)